MHDSTPPPPMPEPVARFGSQYLIALTLAVAIGSVLYRIFTRERLGHSAALFIGIPATLAILLALTPRAKTATGGIVRGITFALLIIAPLLGEGYLCILIAAPLFYLVGILIGAIVDWSQRKRSTTVTCLAVFLLPMCLEGITPQLSFNRAQTVEAQAIVNASAAAVAEALAQSPDLQTSLPKPLRVGFPRPISACGTGLALGDLRTIHFTGAEGDPPGDLVMRIVESRPGYIRFETISDSTKLTQWIRWTSSEVTLRPLDSTHTAVTWRIHFDRELDPTWYFTPWERMAVKQAAAYLIVANATPHEAKP